MNELYTVLFFFVFTHGVHYVYFKLPLCFYLVSAVFLKKSSDF